MTDYERGWMYGGLAVFAVVFFAVLAPELIAWRPDGYHALWIQNAHKGVMEAIPVVVPMLAVIGLANVVFQFVLPWFAARKRREDTRQE